MNSAHRRTFRGLACGAAVLVFVAGALGQETLPQLESRLAEARSKLAAPGMRESARFDLIRQCDDLERGMIGASLTDERQATWLADRAAWALELAGEDGADAAVLYGLPAAAQLRAAHARAQEALDLLARADHAATQTSEKLEAEMVKLGGSEQGKVRAAAIEATLSTLVDAEQGERIPRLRSLARLLLGASGRSASDRESVQTAAKDLAALGPGPGPQADARAVTLGTALVHSVGTGPERADEVFDLAAGQFRPVAKKYVPGGEQSALALRARLGLLRAGRECPARVRSDDADRERTIDLMEAEAKSAAMFDRASRERGARTLLLGSAIGMIVDAVKAAGFGGTEDAVRLRMYDKLASALPAGAPLDRLPPEATLARAVARVREAGMGDALAREDASAMLAVLAARTDASPELRSQARWERAVIAGASGDALAEVDAVGAVVKADPETDRGLAAARRVFDLFARQQASAGAGTEGPGSLDDKWRSRLGTLREALGVLARRDVPGSARWKSETIRLSIAELGMTQGPEGFAAVDRALALLEGAAGTPAEIGALSGTLWQAMDRRTVALARRAEAGTDSKARAEWEALLPQARRASAWARASEAERTAAYGMLLGEALEGAESAEGAGVLGSLSGTSVDQPGTATFSRYRLALGRAQRRAGDNARAVSTFRDLADRLEGAPGSASPEAAYWAAWSEMLGIMQAENTDGARSGEIRVQIKRLELVDVRLGGSPYAERIRAVKGAVGE